MTEVLPRENSNIKQNNVSNIKQNYVSNKVQGI